MAAKDPSTEPLLCGSRCAYCKTPTGDRKAGASFPFLEAAVLWSTCGACVRALGQVLTGELDLAPIRVSLGPGPRD